MVENPNRSLGELPLMAEEEEKKAVLAAAAQRKKRLSPQLQNLLKKAVAKKRAPV